MFNYRFIFKAACVIYVAPSGFIFWFFYFGCKRYLYDILTKASVVKKKIPLLILCNKVDKVTAHTKEFIRRQLEKEMYVY